MAGPAGMPRRWSTAERRAAEGRRAPEVQARLAGIGGEIAASTAEQMRDRVARELQIWTKTVGDAGIAKQ